MSRDEFIDVAEVHFFSTPFEYFSASRFFTSNFSLQLLDWLERSAPWSLVEKDFYEQYEFSLFDATLPEHLALLTLPALLFEVKTRLEQIFGTRLANKIDFNAHKLINGQRIRIHNDFLPGQESYRLVIQLNRGWTWKDGGLLLLFNSDDPADVHKIVFPIHDSCLAFRISDRSNHAVSTIHGGERYTVVYSFYGE
jgi:Rps23 Pro-64 3,4-dihydroxylase Tpa1-like proline 4-hydroxylase